MSIFSAVGSLVGTALGGGFSKQKETAQSRAAGDYYNQLAELLKLNRETNVADMQAIYEALRDQEENPMFRDLMAKEKSHVLNRSRQALADMMLVDQRARARGVGRGLIQGDRRDETMAREYNRVYDESNTDARDSTRAYLSGLLQPLGTASNALTGNATQMQGVADGMNRLGEQAADRNAMNQRTTAGAGATIGQIGGSLAEQLFDANEWSLT